MEFRNGELLQLIECIESTQNEVKRKMIDAEVSSDARKSLRESHAQKKFAGRRNSLRRALHHPLSSSVFLCSPRVHAAKRKLACDAGTMARGEEVLAFSKTYGFPMVSVRELVDYRKLI